MRSIRMYPTAVITTAVLLGGLGAVSPADAAGGAGRVVARSGGCSASSLWDMKASLDNRRISLEYSVDSNVVRQRWTVRITHNGRAVFSGNRATTLRSGSLSADILAANRAGRDRFRALARNPRSGEVCRGFVRF